MTLALTRIDIGTLARSGDERFPLSQTGRIQFNRSDGLQAVLTHTVLLGPACQNRKPADLRRLAVLMILKEAMRVVADNDPPVSPGIYTVREIFSYPPEGTA